MELLSLPPVLNLQLLRFDMDLYGTKKKVTDSIIIPERLNLARFLKRDKGIANIEVAFINVLFYAIECFSISTDEHAASHYCQTTSNSVIMKGENFPNMSSTSASLHNIMPENDKSSSLPDSPVIPKCSLLDLPISEVSIGVPLHKHHKLNSTHLKLDPLSLSLHGSISHNIIVPATPSPKVEPVPVIPDCEGEYSCEYELVAILRHRGTSANAGHYVAEVRQDDGVWYSFNDQQVV